MRIGVLPCANLAGIRPVSCRSSISRRDDALSRTERINGLMDRWRKDVAGAAAQACFIRAGIANEVRKAQTDE